ncbi:MAG TPA: AI-2E family transporter [Candidatus Saccharimonadales bacterium]|nr:AI-2E family transporter [Candidatus Saccharimonadales bacterium]
MADSRPAALRDPTNAGSSRFAATFFGLGSLVFGLLLVYVAVVLIDSFSTIFLICFLAWLLAFIVSPLVDVIADRLRIGGRGAAIALVYVVITAGIVALVIGIASIGAAEVADFLGRSAETTARVNATLATIQSTLGIDPAVLSLPAVFHQAAATVIPQVTASFTGQIQAIAGATIAVVGNLFIVVILSLYMVAGSQGILDKVNRIVPNRYADELELVERTVSHAFGGFLRTQVTLVVVQVVLTISVGLAFGLPYLFVTGIVSALAMFIPFFGPPIALFPPILMAALFRPGVLIPVALILVGVQTVLVNVGQPRLMRHSIGLHPILVLLALLVGAKVAGLWGAIFGIPIVAVGAILVGYFIDLRAVAEVEGVDVETVSAELLATDPGISPEEVVAVAADRAEAAQAAQTDGAS